MPQLGQSELALWADTRGSSPEDPSFALPAARTRAGFHKAKTFLLGLQKQKQRYEMKPASSLSACWEEFVSKRRPGTGTDGRSTQRV